MPRYVILHGSHTRCSLLCEVIADRPSGLRVRVVRDLTAPEGVPTILGTMLVNSNRVVVDNATPQMQDILYAIGVAQDQEKMELEKRHREQWQAALNDIDPWKKVA